jgi:hypothetical protein
MYRDADLDDAWLDLVGFDAGGAAVDLAVRVGLKLRLLRRFAHTRAKALVKAMRERLRISGMGVRAELKAKKSAKAKKVASKSGGAQAGPSGVLDTVRRQMRIMGP